MNSRVVRRLLIYGCIIAPLALLLWWTPFAPKDRVVVSLDAAGRVSINGKPSTERQFVASLDAALKQNPGPVELRADPAASTTALVPVMEALRQAGVQDVRFTTQ